MTAQLTTDKRYGRDANARQMNVTLSAKEHAEWEKVKGNDTNARTLMRLVRIPPQVIATAEELREAKRTIAILEQNAVQRGSSWSGSGRAGSKEKR